MLAAGWNRIGEQTRFYFLTPQLDPDALIPTGPRFSDRSPKWVWAPGLQDVGRTVVGSSGS